MSKKKPKNNASKHLSLVPESKIRHLLPEDYKSTGTRFVVVSQNSRLKAGREKHNVALVKDKYKKDRLERLVRIWLERLSKKYGIAAIEKERYLHLLLKLILPPIVKNGYEGKLRILQKIYAVSISAGTLATPTINYSEKWTSLGSSTQVLRSDLNES